MSLDALIGICSSISITGLPAIRPPSRLGERKYPFSQRTINIRHTLVMIVCMLEVLIGSKQNILSI